ncbi:TPA: gp53-like domain-containing protein, partial [Enterobacter hormaechei]
ASDRSGILGLISAGGYLKIPLSEAGKQKILLLQWGTVSNSGAGTVGEATYPIAFPSGVLSGLLTGVDTINGGFTASFGPRSTIGFSAVFRDVSNAPYPHIPTRLQTACYIMLGY